MAKRRSLPPPVAPPSRGAALLQQPQRLLVLGAAVLAVLVPLLQVTDLAVPGRAVLATLFFLVVPGAPGVVLLRVRELTLYVALVLSVSLSSLLLVSLLLLEADRSHPLLTTSLIGLLGLLLTRPALRVLARTVPEPRTSSHDVRERWVGLLAVVVSVGLWLVAVASVHLDELGSLGLAGKVGPAYWVALAVLAAVAARHVRRTDPDPVVLAAVAAAVTLELFGFLNAADTAASFPTGWLHVGFAQYISDHGHVAHYYDARFSWPAFFGAAAVLNDTAGVGNAVPFLKPAPVVDVLLLLPGIWSLARSITRSPQVAWVSLFTFLSLDWYEQEYFSPQATVYVLYVGVLATLVHYAPSPSVLVGPEAPWRHPLNRIWAPVPRPADAGPRLTLGREAVILVVCAAITVTHQLTPINLLVTLAVLALTGATRMRGLWPLLALVFIAWFVFGASEYWRSNIGSILNDIGHLGSTVGSSVGGRIVGDPVHIRLQTVRLAWSAGSVLLALFAVWRLRHTTWFWMLLGLALGPFSLLVVQSYGGEVALRSFLYAEPVLAPLMAMTVMSVLGLLPERVRWPLLGVLLLTAFTLLTATRGANAAFERETAADISASRFAFETPSAIPGPRTIGLAEYAAFAGFEHVTQWTIVPMDPLSCEGSLDIAPCARKLAPDFILVTKTMDNLGVLQDGQRPGWTDRLAADLERDGLYTRPFSRPGAFVLQRVGPRP